MRRALVPLLAISLLAAACGKDEPAVKDGVLAGTITVAAAGGEGEIKALQEVADAFEAAHAGTTVELDTVASAGDLVAKLTTSFAAGSAPDLFVLNYRRLGGFAAKGVVAPVPAGSTQGLFPGPLAAFTFGGKLLCRPSNASSMVVYLNTTLFARAGVALPARTWTWDDLRSTAEALKAKGVSSIAFDPALIRLAPFVWSNGGEVVDDADAPTKVDLTGTPARQALQYLLDLQRTGLSATDRAAQDPEDAFTAGKVAMLLESRRAVPGLRKAAGLAFDVAPVPTRKTATSVLHSDGYCVTKAGKNSPLAQAFAEFAASGEGAKVLARAGRSVPMSVEVARSADFLAPQLQPKSSSVFLDQAQTARALPHSLGWNEAEAVTDDILTQLFAGKTTLDKAVADIAAQTKLALAEG